MSEELELIPELQNEFEKIKAAALITKLSDEVRKLRADRDSLAQECEMLREACKGAMRIANEYYAFGLEGFGQEYGLLKEVAND